MKVLDFRSDTLTRPTESMREAMKNASVGDDQYGEDPTVNELQELAAEKLGKEAGLFVPSGMMGNLAALMAHAERGDSIILDDQQHIFTSEAGAVSSVAGLLPRLIPSDLGVMDPDKVEFVMQNVYPPVTVVSSENTHNMSGGTVITREQLRALVEVAHTNGARFHLDGARIFNAATALNLEASDLAAEVDSVMFCLSKGLSAPVGSVLVGDADFIERAHAVRKRLGGAMRQAGVLAAAGIVALNDLVDRLADDHKNARRLAEGIVELGVFDVDLETVQSNMFNADGSTHNLTAEQMVDKLEDIGIRVNARPPSRVRMVTHRHISEADIAEALDRLAGIKETL